MKKTVPKEVPKEKKDSLNMVVLVWLLTFLSAPTINTLVPAFFTPGEKTVDWANVLQEMTLSFFELAFITLSISFIISLFGKKEFPSLFKDSLLRYTFVIASLINVVSIIMTLFWFFESEIIS